MEQRRSMFDSDIVVAPLSEMPDFVQQNVTKFESLLDLELSDSEVVAGRAH